MTALADVDQLQQTYLTLLTNQTQSLAWMTRLVDGAMNAINMVQLHKLVLWRGRGPLLFFVVRCVISKRGSITHTHTHIQCGQGLLGWQRGGA